MRLLNLPLIQPYSRSTQLQPTTESINVTLKEKVMTKEEKAKAYTEGKSSSPVFRDAHTRDYLAGYNQALEDSKELIANEVEFLSGILDVKDNKLPNGVSSTIRFRITVLKEFIKS